MSDQIAEVQYSYKYDQFDNENINGLKGLTPSCSQCRLFIQDFVSAQVKVILTVTSFLCDLHILFPLKNEEEK